jgi:hypothetical protein
MAKKDRRGARESGERATRWTVRGVPAHLQRSAGDLARARGQTLGQWLSEVVAAAVADAGDATLPAASGWRQSIEDRLTRLETITALGAPRTGGAARRAGRSSAGGPSPPATAI